MSVGATVAVQPVSAAQTPPVPGFSVAVLSSVPVAPAVPVSVNTSSPPAARLKLVGAHYQARDPAVVAHRKDDGVALAGQEGATQRDRAVRDGLGGAVVSCAPASLTPVLKIDGGLAHEITGIWVLS